MLVSPSQHIIKYMIIWFTLWSPTNSRSFKHVCLKKKIKIEIIEIINKMITYNFNNKGIYGNIQSPKMK